MHKDTVDKYKIYMHTHLTAVLEKITKTKTVLSTDSHFGPIDRFVM